MDRSCIQHDSQLNLMQQGSTKLEMQAQDAVNDLKCHMIHIAMTMSGFGL